MRHSSGTLSPASTVTSETRQRADRETLKRLIPFLLVYKWRIAFAIALMVIAKIANVGVPMLLKELIDAMNLPATELVSLFQVPVALVLGYGLLRFSVSLLTELRELVFAKATQGMTRTIALQTFEHLHGLSLRFHLERQTGGMTRDIERGVRGIESLISYSIYSIIPTLIEMMLVLGILAVKFDFAFAAITVCALATYIFFTFKVTEWRTQYRRQANEFDSAAHTRAIDSLLNYETVKYFNNEAFESKRYSQSLEQLQQARLKAQTTLSMLNTGQQLIISAALIAILWRATQGVLQKQMSLGDFVMINTFMIQLYIPLNFLGVIYREIKQSLTDLDRMFTLMEKEREIADLPNAPALQLQGPPQVEFTGVSFGYDTERLILRNLSFTIPAGQTVAVVGPSGAGKSTLARLMFRFYDVQQGSISINGQDIRRVSQDSLRHAIGIVPQDTVLFNDTLAYNIGYGKPSASQAQIEEVARLAHIDGFVAQAPKGYNTMVGERGLKLSGGEKQRVAIARTLLKNPPILILDEATSALDSANERAIQSELRTVALNRTTLVIAHRLSTVVDAHEILVLEQGCIAERGNHASLLALGGKYARMWNLQQTQEAKDVESSAVLEN